LPLPGLPPVPPPAKVPAAVEVALPPVAVVESALPLAAKVEAALPPAAGVEAALPLAAGVEAALPLAAGVEAALLPVPPAHQGITAITASPVRRPGGILSTIRALTHDSTLPSALATIGSL